MRVVQRYNLSDHLGASEMGFISFVEVDVVVQTFESKSIALLIR